MLLAACGGQDGLGGEGLQLMVKVGQRVGVGGGLCSMALCKIGVHVTYVAEMAFYAFCSCSDCCLLNTLWVHDCGGTRGGGT